MLPTNPWDLHTLVPDSLLLEQHRHQDRPFCKPCKPKSPTLRDRSPSPGSPTRWHRRAPQNQGRRLPGKPHPVIRGKKRGKPAAATFVIKVCYVHLGSNAQLQLHLENIPDIHSNESAGTSVWRSSLTQILWLHSGCV